MFSPTPTLINKTIHRAHNRKFQDKMPFFRHVLLLYFRTKIVIKKLHREKFSDINYYKKLVSPLTFRDFTCSSIEKSGNFSQILVTITAILVNVDKFTVIFTRMFIFRMREITERPYQNSSNFTRKFLPVQKLYLNGVRYLPVPTQYWLGVILDY